MNVRKALLRQESWMRTLCAGSLQHCPAKDSCSGIQFQRLILSPFPLQKSWSRSRRYVQRLFLSLTYRIKWKAYIPQTHFYLMTQGWDGRPPLRVAMLAIAFCSSHFCRHRSFLLHHYSPDKCKKIT